MKRRILSGIGTQVAGRWLWLTMLACALSGIVRAEDSIKIRLATLAPKDSSFHKTLLAMGEKWRNSTGGAVKLTIYTDGSQGGEADMVRRIRVGQLQAALLTAPGLSQIEESITALQLMPMMIRNFDELDYVRDQLLPMLEKRFAEKGFVILFLGDAGWVRFFSKHPAVRPDDFKKMKMFVWSGDTHSTEIMKNVGINAVPLEQTEILTGLQTGLIDSVPTIPVYALAGQFFNPAPYMLEVNWVPLTGAAVITKKAWDTIPESQRAAMKKAAVEAGEAIKKRSRAESDEAVEAMKKHGLKVQTLTPEQVTEWEKFGEVVYPRIRGDIVRADLFDEVQRMLKEYRATHGSK
jgi:TRAP-type C4-dicarboxylate transport system substrate-binding protein